MCGLIRLNYNEKEAIANDTNWKKVSRANTCLVSSYILDCPGVSRFITADDYLRHH